jgi:hypothetical protein
MVRPAEHTGRQATPGTGRSEQLDFRTRTWGMFVRQLEELGQSVCRRSVRKDGQSSVIDSLQDLFLSSLNTFLKGCKFGAVQLKYVAPHLKYGAVLLKYSAFAPAKMTHP